MEEKSIYRPLLYIWKSLMIKKTWDKRKRRIIIIYVIREVKKYHLQISYRYKKIFKKETKMTVVDLAVISENNDNQNAMARSKNISTYENIDRNIGNHKRKIKPIIIRFNGRTVASGSLFSITILL